MKTKKTEILGIQAPKQWFDLPSGIEVEFTFWQLLDEMGSWFMQGAAIVGGGPYTTTPVPLTGEINVVSPGGIKVYFPMWGTVITVSNGADFNIPSGDHVILLTDIEYPVVTQSKALQFVTPGDDVKNLGQFCFFLGGRFGDSVFMRPDSVQ